MAATCYLPLTDNGSLEKNLGTRHRAGLGISEVTDSMTIIVSEETGEVSIAYRGQLYKALDEDGIRRKLSKIQRRRDDRPSRRRIKKGGLKVEQEKK